MALLLFSAQRFKRCLTKNTFLAVTNNAFYRSSLSLLSTIHYSSVSLFFWIYGFSGKCQLQQALLLLLWAIQNDVVGVVGICAHLVWYLAKKIRYFRISNKLFLILKAFLFVDGAAAVVILFPLRAHCVIETVPVITWLLVYVGLKHWPAKRHSIKKNSVYTTEYMLHDIFTKLIISSINNK